MRPKPLLTASTPSILIAGKDKVSTLQLQQNPAAFDSRLRPGGRLRATVDAPQLWLGCNALFQNFRTLAGINFDIALWFFAGAPRDAFDESGIIENVQAILLALAVIVLIRIAIASSGATRTAAIAFGFICFAVCFREVDLRTWDVHEWAIKLTTGKIRNRMFLVAAALLGIYLILRRKHLLPIIQQALSRECRPLQVAVALVIMASTMEDVFYHTRLNKFWEEGLEVVAYGLVLHAALAGYWVPRESKP